MKVNDEFYLASDEEINALIEQYETDLEKFKEIADAVLSENEFGDETGPVIGDMSDKMYTMMLGKLKEKTTVMSENTQNYITVMNDNDKLV